MINTNDYKYKQKLKQIRKNRQFPHTSMIQSSALKQTPSPIYPTYIDQQTAPHQFLCPISRQVMKDPVIIQDGYSYEKVVIQKWFKDKDKSPCTGLKVQNKKLVQNRALKQCIEFHNIRERKANQSAQKVIQSANINIKNILPEIINQIGLIDIDKIVTIIIQNLELRRIIKAFGVQYEKIQRIFATQNKTVCYQCTRVSCICENVKNVLKRAENILKSNTIVESINISAREFEYIPISTTDLKKIDFRQIRKQQWQTKIFKSYGIQKSSIESLVKRIRIVNQISDSHFIHVWRTQLPVKDFFDQIVSALKLNKCVYKKIVKEVGSRVLDLKVQLDQLGLKQGQYLIIEHGKGDSSVFRGEEIKCQHCYHMKTEKVKCQCGLVSYCSKECAVKDIQYHQKKCNKGVQLTYL